MKFVIFSCLLAFCALEIVNAGKNDEDVQKKLDELSHSNYQPQLNDFLDKKGRKTEALLKAAKQAKKNTVGCDQDFDESREEIYITFVNECSDCVQDAKKKNNYQAAVDCCDKKFKIAKSKADVMVNEVKYCLDGL